MKTSAIILFSFLFLLTACENTTPKPPSPFAGKDSIGVNSPSKDMNTIPDDTRPTLYLQGIYATSNNEMVGHIFDEKDPTVWKSRSGTGPDEGVLIFFQDKTFIQKIRIDAPIGEGIASAKEIIIYGDEIPVGQGKIGESIHLENTYSSLFIRFGKTNKMTDLSMEDGEKKGIIRHFSRSHAVGIKSIKMWGDDGKELRLIAPRKVEGQMVSSSTLQSSPKYSTANLFDNKKSTAWVEGKDGNGIGEQLSFEFFQPVEIDAIKIWNGYQRSTNTYQSNARLKGFSLGESGGKSYEYTLRDDAAAQRIGLRVPLKNKFELKINSAYDGTKYQDLAISEILFFENGKPLQLFIENKLREFSQTLDVKGTNLESLMDTRITNEMDYGPSGFYVDRSLILRSNGTFSIYLSEKMYPATEDGDTETYETKADGTWEIQSASATKSILKLTGKLVDITAALAQAKGKNEEAEIFQIFKDQLTIENGLIKGEQMLDEMIIR